MRVERPSQLGENPNEVVVLPQALEQALAFKDQRAQELGVNPEEVTIGKKLYYLYISKKLIK